MNKSLLLFVWLVAVGLLSACGGDEEPFPKAEPEFRVETENAPEVGIPITFVNETLNADSYSWDFGDGQTSNQVAPQITYTTAGTYTVTLTATTKDGQETVYTDELGVGQRQLVGFAIYSIEFEDEFGSPWDELSGPDVQVLLLDPEDADPANAYLSPIAVNVGINADSEGVDIALPFGLGELSSSIVLTNTAWRIFLFDDDEEIEEGEYEQMFGYEFNPVTTIFSAYDSDNEIGVIYFLQGGYEIILDFEIVVP